MFRTIARSDRGERSRRAAAAAAFRRADLTLALLVVGGMSLSGCAARQVDFSMIAQPDRPAALDAYDVFVGDWDWEATLVNGDAGSRQWRGTASWRWTLDDRCLHGVMESHCEDAAFKSAGVWSVDSRSGEYAWSMFNNWGYPQHGTATYDADKRTWSMPHRSTGLDGTPSHGRYTMTVVDENTLAWTMAEWADGLHLVKKAEMSGKYVRRMANGE